MYISILRLINETIMNDNMGYIEPGRIEGIEIGRRQGRKSSGVLEDFCRTES